MNSKLALGLVGLALLVGLVLFFALGPGDARRGRDVGALPPAPPAPAVTEAALVEADALEVPASATAREVTRVATEAAAPVPWRGELAGVVGRVVEQDGTPVPGLPVALLEFDASILFDGSALDEDPGSLELEETVTDREGRFVMGGARGPAFHGLGLDLGGPRASVRVIDQALPHRQRTDLGDIVLAPYGVLTGRVLDENGAPVVGARVRAGPFPEEVLLGTPWEFRAQSLVAVSLLAQGGDPRGIIEPPGWVRQALDRFPVPTTTSAADGTFRLEGVALATVIGGVDKPGLVGVPIGPLDLAAEGQHDLGDLVLVAGRTVHGVVEDAVGDPVAGAEVYAGAEIAPGTAAILQPCGTTDAEGEFELTGVRAEGQIVAVARRSPHEPWGITYTARPEGVLVEMETLVGLTVNVRNEIGEPLSGARLQIRPGAPQKDEIGFGMALGFLPRPVSPQGVFREVEAGRYVNERLSAGTYDLVVRVAGLAPAERTVECLGEVNEVTLVCAAGTWVDLTVVDAVTKAPVEDARASVVRLAPSGLVKLARASSDGAGQARLGPLSDGSFSAPEAGQRRGFPTQTTLLVKHPRYSDHSAPLLPHSGPLVVALESGGILEGRVHWGGAVPTRLYMLSLEPRGIEDGRELFHLPRLALTGLEGEFRIADLAPGKYQVTLIERFLDQDPLGLMAAEISPTTVHEQEVEIENGKTTELVIDLTPTGRGATARLLGQVRVDGRPLEGAEVRLSGAESVRVLTDARGRYETADFAIRDSTYLRVKGTIRLPDGGEKELQLHEESLELQRDEVRELNLDFYPMTLRARVLDGVTAEPVAGALVSAVPAGKGNQRWFRNDGNRTNALGEVELVILEAGPFSISTRAEGFAQSSTTVEVPPEGLSEPALVRLERALPCAGHVLVPGALTDAPKGFSYLWVQGDENGASQGTQLQPPDYAFELDSLSEGKYQAMLFIGGQRGQSQPFELGPDGDRDLVLTFVPQQQ